MSFLEKLKHGQTTLSFEFFPPKNPAGWSTLYGTLSDLASEKPDYVSVTYGAGGSTREKTVDLVGRIQGELGISSVAHLTCVGHSRTEIHNILLTLEQKGITTVLALRGDPPKGQGGFVPHPEGFQDSAQLTAYIKKHFSLNVAVACYPEKHPQASDLNADLEFLKVKQDCGADFAISQLFFDNSKFLKFTDQAQNMGIQIPILAGIMPLTSPEQLERFVSMAGTSIPQVLQNEVIASANPTQVGIDYGIQQCSELITQGVAGIHLYTLNKTKASQQIVVGLRTLNKIK